MPSSFSANLNLELQATGEDAGTWGQNLNNNVLSILDSVLGNAFSLPLTNIDVTLTMTQTQNNYFILSGILTANVNIIFPNIGRTIFVQNSTTGNFTVTMKMASGSNSIVFPQGTSGFVILNNTTIVQAPNVRGPLTAVSGNLPAFSGTSGDVLSDSGVAVPVFATQAEAQAGASATVYMSPLRTAQYVTARIASQAAAQAGTDNNAMMTPLRTAQAIVIQATPHPSGSTNPNELNFPIGTCLTVTDGVLTRNQTCNVYLSNTDSANYVITPTGNILAGTWLARGRISSTVMLVQRAT